MQAFSIPDVPLIAQTKNMACWYASAQMLIQWRRSRTLSTEVAHPDPSEVGTLEQAFIANDGLPVGRILELAKQLGLEDVPPMTPSPGAVASTLQRYGPIWFAGFHPSGHVVVITGISPTDIAINDPWPVNQGQCRTISFERFRQILQP